MAQHRSNLADGKSMQIRGKMPYSCYPPSISLAAYRYGNRSFFYLLFSHTLRPEEKIGEWWAPNANILWRRWSPRCWSTGFLCRRRHVVAHTFPQVWQGGNSLITICSTSHLSCFVKLLASERTAGCGTTRAHQETKVTFPVITLWCRSHPWLEWVHLDK